MPLDIPTLSLGESFAALGAACLVGITLIALLGKWRRERLDREWQAHIERQESVRPRREDTRPQSAFLDSLYEMGRALDRVLEETR